MYEKRANREACPLSTLCDFFASFWIVKKFRMTFEVVDDFRDGTVTCDVRRCTEAILRQVERDDQALHRRVEAED